MLILNATVYFYKPNENANALDHDLSTKIILRPAINFGNDMLFSGTIIVDNQIEVLERGQNYDVMIEMPTIEHEAFSEINNALMTKGVFPIQAGRRTIGKARVIDYVFE